MGVRPGGGWGGVDMNQECQNEKKSRGGGGRVRSGEGGCVPRIEKFVKMKEDWIRTHDLRVRKPALLSPRLNTITITKYE